MDYSRVELAADVVARSEATWQSHAFGESSGDRHASLAMTWSSTANGPQRRRRGEIGSPKG